MLSLNRIPSTCIGTLHRVLLTNCPVFSCHNSKGSFIITILTGKWAVGAASHLVFLEFTSLEVVKAGVRAGHCHKLALSLLRTTIQMLVKATSLTSPLTSQTLVGTVDRILGANQPVLTGHCDVDGFVGRWGNRSPCAPRADTAGNYHHRSEYRPLSQTGTLPQQSSGSDVC